MALHLPLPQMTWKGSALLELLLAQYPTVRRRAHSSAHTQLVRSIPILGILIILFFRCMGAMLNRTRGDIRWGLVALTAAMFSFATITLTSYLNTLSISYSRDLNFPVPPGPQPGSNNPPIAQPGPPGPPPGPLGFQVFICRMPFSIIAYILLPVNQWLADGLLVGRA